MCGVISHAEAPRPDSDTEDMAAVDAGELGMGSSEALTVDNPRHRVTLDAFRIDRREVSNARFARFVKATGYVTEAERRGWGHVFDGGGLVEVKGADWQHPAGPDDTIEGKGDRPVVQVSQHDAVAFCAWAKKRLPTEAEWECAALGGLGEAKYAWGNGPPDGRACFGLGPTGRPAAVGTFKPNGFGLYDMGGNVAEWCSDWYEQDYYRVSPSRNPTGPASGRMRVIRGGSFASAAEELSVSTRRTGFPSSGYADVGFRTCARLLPPAQPGSDQSVPNR
jgi:formylglycine-generating enzyme required for sulfatase activity